MKIVSKRKPNKTPNAELKEHIESFEGTGKFGTSKNLVTGFVKGNPNTRKTNDGVKTASVDYRGMSNSYKSIHG